MKKLVDDFYLIFFKMYEIQDTELNKSQNLSLKRKAFSNNLMYLWHLKLSHINLKRIDRLVKEGPLSSLTIQSLLVFTSCLKEKMTKIFFLAKGNRFKCVLELIHTYVCGLIGLHNYSPSAAKLP